MDKNPSLARWIPGFVFRLLSRILRIDFMNDLRIKTNLEMFFLPNESCLHRDFIYLKK